jgi:hypothetical protein
MAGSWQTGINLDHLLTFSGSIVVSQLEYEERMIRLEPSIAAPPKYLGGDCNCINLLQAAQTGDSAANKYRTSAWPIHR